MGMQRSLINTLKVTKTDLLVVCTSKLFPASSTQRNKPYLFSLTQYRKGLF